jgi:GntR family phosphonate transport system transcriptional regulator
VIYRSLVPDWDASEYLYIQLADDLTAKIESGDFPAGSRLPNDAELSETYEVDRMTVQRALELLAERGLVRTAQGRGALVLAPES